MWLLIFLISLAAAIFGNYDEEQNLTTVIAQTLTYFMTAVLGAGLCFCMLSIFKKIDDD